MRNGVFVAFAALAIACSSIEVASQQSNLATTTLSSLQSQFKFRERVASDGTKAKLPARSVIPQSGVIAVDAQVALPSNAAGAATIATTNGTMSIAVALRGADASAAALTTGGSAVYLKGDARGGHIVQTTVRDGVESFVMFNASPTSDTIFDVAMNGVHGLRFVEGVLEFLDKGGAPRLRMAPPVVVDANGVVADVTTSIEGCAYDDSALPPWGRKTTAPGASSCAVHLSWSDAGLTYPVLLDPSWTATASMAVARRWHGAALLSSMKVLVIDGEGASAAYIASCELYDPSTGTWATVRRPSVARRRFTTTMIDGGKVLIAGGETSSGPTASSEVYNPSTGIWSATGAMTTSRAYHDAVYVSSIGKVLVAGGKSAGGAVLSSAELYNPSSGTWSTTGSFSTARMNHSLTALRDQTILAAGGVGSSSNVLASTEIYDPSAGTWSTGASLNVARHRHRAVRLDDDRVVFTGGYIDAGATAAIAVGETYDSTLRAFAIQDVIGAPRGDHGAVALAEDRVLVIGGSTGTAPLSDTQMYYGNRATAVDNGPLNTPTSQASATLMGNGYVLVAGGASPGGITNAAATSGPYLYVYGRDGAAHRVQVTSVSGDWNTSFTLGVLYDSTSASVTYDWVGGVGQSLRARVYDAIGTPLGTVVTAYRGDATFTSADGSQQVTYNRNLVPPQGIAFLDDKVIVLGPESVMDKKLVALLGNANIARITQAWVRNWTFTARTNINSMTAAQQSDLWSALAYLTTTATYTFHVRAYQYQGSEWIMHTDCTSLTCPDHDPNTFTAPATRCVNDQQDTYPNCNAWPIVWRDVDVVRNHYTIDHDSYPQFFKHHHTFIAQIESWITDPGGYDQTFGVSDILPYGHLPYWDASAGPMPTTFYSTPLPSNGTNCPSTTSTSGEGMVINGNCAWCADQSFYQPDYFHALTVAICDYSGSSQGDWQWFNPSGLDCVGIHNWHGCIHTNTGGPPTKGIWYPPINVGSFATLDAPGSPIFFPFHAYIDYLYGSRLDCP